MRKRNLIWQVIRREFAIIRKRPIYLLGSVAVMAFCSLFFLTFFSQGLPHDLPIGIVDKDESWVSREFARNLDATQLGKVVKYDDFTAAREDMMKGKLTSICVIPEDAYSDILANRQPQFTYYLNGLYFVGGALAYKDILTLVNLANGAVKREVLRAKGFNDDAIMGMIQPISIDTHQIGNAYTNYGYYLTNIMLPGMLEMIVIIVLIYSLGAEMKYGTSRHLMKLTGGSISLALVGKLSVFTLLFSVLGIIMELLLYSVMGFPIAGSVWNMVINVVLLVLSSESVAIFIIGCLPVTRLALSIGALYSVMGFTMAGFTLPIETMPALLQGWSWAFPLRHYYLFYTQEVIFGSGFAGWWPEVVKMLVFLFLPLPVLGRLKKAYLELNYPRE